MIVPAVHEYFDELAMIGAGLFTVLAFVICAGLLVLFVALRPSKAIEWGWVILFFGFSFVISTRIYLNATGRSHFGVQEQAFIWLIVDACLLAFAGTLVYTLRRVFTPRFWRERRDRARREVMGPQDTEG